MTMLVNKEKICSPRHPHLHCSPAMLTPDMKMRNPRFTRLSSHTNRSDIVWGFPSDQLNRQTEMTTLGK